MAVRILVVDDDRAVRESLRRSLSFNGYSVALAQDGVEALDLIASDRPDALVLDVMMPKLDGLEVCRRIRKHGAIPILMLSAKAEDMDKIMGLMTGADDYMVKPFAMRELEARLRALNRGLARNPASTRSDAAIAYDAGTMTATREGHRIALTRLQGRLLDALLAEAPKIVAHERLLRIAWGADAGDMAALHTQMYELRALVDKPFGVPLIRSVRGVGYRILPP